MRISDWSSDVCSSDLVQILASALAVRGRHRQGVSHCARKPLPALIPLRLPPKAARNRAYPRPAGKNARFMITAIRAMFSSTIGKFLALAFVALVGVAFALSDVKIGRASCRERVCQYV